MPAATAMPALSVAPPSSRKMKATAPRIKATHQHIDATSDIIRLESTTEPVSPFSPSSSPSAPTFSSFKSTAKEVTALGATKLARWDRKSHEERQRLAMGMRPTPNLKTPLNALRGMRQKNAMRRERTETRARDSGLEVKSAKRKRRESRGSEPQTAGGEDVGLGRTTDSGSVIRVDRNTVQRLQRGDRQMSMAKRLKR